MWIQLVIVLLGTAWVTEAGKCAQDELPATKDACIAGLKNSLTDKSAYWFGTGYTSQCPSAKAMSLECVTNLGDLLGSSVKDLTNLEAAEIDRILNVTYVSKPGSYMGCDYTYEQTDSLRFPVDPLSSMSPMEPWHARDLPELSWTSEPNKQYALVVVDVATNILHGLYLNIMENDIDAATAVKAYHGPKNPSRRNNLYIFLLYEQTAMDISLPKNVSDVLMPPGGGWGGAGAMGEGGSMGGAAGGEGGMMGGGEGGAGGPPGPTGGMARADWKIGDLMAQVQVRGPIAMSNVLARSDRYSLDYMGKMGVVSDCVPYVKKAYMDQKHNERPFLPEDPDLSVFLRIHFSTERLAFQYCCEETVYEPRMFFLEPTSTKLVLAGETRSSNNVTVMLQMNKMYPNPAMDFKDKHYLLLMVDPDVPSVAVGSNERPLLHMLAYNNKVDAMGKLVYGKVLQPYSGPMPPDDKHHTYYYMLYEQATPLEDFNTTDYTDPNCTRARDRCLFNVGAMVQEQNLTLVGVSWMVAENDDFVNWSRGNEESKEVCGADRYPCPVPDPNSATRMTSSSTSPVPDPNSATRMTSSSTSALCLLGAVMVAVMASF